MILFKKAEDLHIYLEKQRKSGKKYGFVPTMGALHEGHISLIEASRKTNDLTVCSIFINPTQFNDQSDFEKYPVTLEKDITKLHMANCDVVFQPLVGEMYPHGTSVIRRYDLGYLEQILEGTYRPGHFQGVCAIVHRLLDIVKPDHLYIGQKDYQQCMVIKKLIEIIGMDSLVRLHISPTLREPGGLAMSSRNSRLSSGERKKATAIFQTLLFVKENIASGDLDDLKKAAEKKLSEDGFKVDYVEVAAAESLQLTKHWDGKEKLVVLAAAYLNEVRLIDNLLVN